MLRARLLAVVIALISSPAFAQTPDSSLSTPTGNEVNISAGGYNYVEPGTLSISIHGVKVGGEYTGTLSLDEPRRWFAMTNVRGTLGGATYDGWCSPFVIIPNHASPNGYQLDQGDAS